MQFKKQCLMQFQLLYFDVQLSAYNDFHKNSYDILSLFNDIIMILFT